MVNCRTTIAVLIFFAATNVVSTDLLAQRGRQMPPEQVTCDRNQLTSYTGVISAAEFLEESVRITIQTDWDTVETVEVRAAEDLKPGMRITAWVCSDCKTPPVIQHLPD